uniref:ATP synthase F0 subunit 8 n=1 Tax=Psoroptes ovis TaxID=83912 RepID=A0A075X8J3_PSOOV|nr:ATP synthase F0 subunit 8 [Psoroptes ovis]AIH15200.1 ATP synthase F0 subunit 8 [Psoroptes ovis]
MMPLPWLMVFFMLFLSVFSFSLLISFNFLSVSNSISKSVKTNCSKLPW